jgi:hypothetical protein
VQRIGIVARQNLVPDSEGVIAPRDRRGHEVVKQADDLVHEEVEALAVPDLPQFEGAWYLGLLREQTPKLLDVAIKDTATAIEGTKLGDDGPTRTFDGALL